MAYVCNYCGRTIFTLETLHKHQKICVSSSNGVSSSKILEKTKEEKSKECQTRIDNINRKQYLNMLKHYETIKNIEVSSYHKDMPLDELKQIHDIAAKEDNKLIEHEKKKSQQKTMSLIKITIKDFIDQNFDEIFDAYSDQILEIYEKNKKEIDYG